jgi:hypothetical protein
MFQDPGIQAYCWQQLADCLRAFVIIHQKTPTKSTSKLLPSLKFLQIDLVNFCEHLPYPGPHFASTIRWRTGAIVDELIVSGSPDSGEFGEEYMLRHLVRDEGLFGSACPLFVSTANGKLIRPLKPSVIYQEVVRAEREVQDTTSVANPEGGKPPKSYRPAGKTIWKWTTESFSSPKRWIEFDRRTGFPAEDIEYAESLFE